jgi:hypothetical protein
MVIVIMLVCTLIGLAVMGAMPKKKKRKKIINNKNIKL